jgi:hypothetical protein
MTAEMLTPIPSKEESALHWRDALQKATQYLDGLRLADEYNPNIADKDGLVTYINGTSNPPPPELVEERKKIAVVLEGLCSVVTSAVLAKSGTDEKMKHDPKLWADPVRFGLTPFLSGYASEEVKYNRRVKGVEVATQFLNILIDAVAGAGQALDAFKKFLEGQGKTISIKGSATQEGYKYACIGMVHEVFQIEGGQWIYVPKIQMYFTHFTRKTFSISTSCASYEEIDFDFSVEKIIAPFKIETWRQDPDFKKQVDAFIKKYNKANIERSENYFDGIFNSIPTMQLRQPRMR